MVKGFKATLFAGVISLGAFAPAFAAAPVISGLPDIQVGDMEDSGATDSNLFVFSDAFKFSDYVTDADTPDNQLKWSFGESTNNNMSTGQNSQYTINGVDAVLKGDAAIAADEALGYPLVKSGANQINSSSDFATFRDIVFSPTSGSAPYPEQSQPNKDAAAAGKLLRFFVTDTTSVGYQDVMIETVDDEFDKLTATDGYQEVVRDKDLATSWVLSGIPSTEIAIAPGVGKLDIIVQPAQAKSRILGWGNGTIYPYDSVGNTKYVLGKFYVSTSNLAAAPLNEVPNFRLRINQEAAVNSSIHFELAKTGFTAPPHEPFYGDQNLPAADVITNALRPSSNAAVPSLYKVHLDPIDVPAAAGSNITAQIESYTFHDPANATLSLQEFALATYDALEKNPANLVWNYNRATGVAGGLGGAKTLAPGFFNAEANFEPGRRQKLFIPGRDAATYTNVFNDGAAGLVGDTDPVPQDVFGLGLVNVYSTAEADRLRVEPGAVYSARFYATSSVPTDSDVAGVESMGNIRFRFQTVAGTVSYMQEVASVSNFSLGSPQADLIAAQAMPGVGSENPDTDASLGTAGEDGGWYNVVLSSPLNAGEIRQDLANNFGAFGAEAGPGVAAPSAKDVTLGVDLIQLPANLTIAGGQVIPFARPNRVMIRVAAIEVYKYPLIDDGGYDYLP
jgi:hypothetical protein